MSRELERAREAGCTLERVHELPDGGRAFALDCRSSARKVALLAKLTDDDARDPWVRRLAEQVAASVGGGELETIAALHALVRDGVRFAAEPTETFSSTRKTLEHGLGDCDDSARALCALLRSIGFTVRLATLGEPPTHVACCVRFLGRWWWLETTLPGALPGEHPVAARRRLGAVKRADIG